MILKNEKCTAVLEIDEKFVLGCEDENYDIIFNPNNIERSRSHDAVRIIAKTDKTLRIAIVTEHDKDGEYSGSLNGEELTVTFGKDAMTINLKTGEILHYGKNAVLYEFDFSELEKFL